MAFAEEAIDKCDSRYQMHYQLYIAKEDQGNAALAKHN